MCALKLNVENRVIEGINIDKEELLFSSLSILIPSISLLGLHSILKRTFLSHYNASILYNLTDGVTLVILYVHKYINVLQIYTH